MSWQLQNEKCHQRAVSVARSIDPALLQAIRAQIGLAAERATPFRVASKALLQEVGLFQQAQKVEKT